MGRPIFTPKNAPSRGAIATPVYLPHPWTQPTHHCKRHTDQISRFPTMHRTDTQTNRSTDRQRPTNGLGDKTHTNTRLCSINDSGTANNIVISYLGGI